MVCEETIPDPEWTRSHIILRDETPLGGGRRMRIPRTLRFVAAVAALLLASAAGATIFPPAGIPYPTGATGASGPGFVMPEQVAFADFNADGSGDLAIANYGTSTLVILRGIGDGTFQPFDEFTNVGSGPFGIAVGDVNGDGKPDIVLTDNAGTSVAVLINNYGAPTCPPQPASCFQPAVFYTTDTLPTSVALADMNGDGILDIVVGTNGTAGIDVLLGNGSGGVGDGTFGAKIAYAPGLSTAYILVADFTGDGKLDVAATDGNSPGALTIYPGNGLGALLVGTPFFAGDRPTQMVLGD